MVSVLQTYTIYWELLTETTFYKF